MASIKTISKSEKANVKLSTEDFALEHLVIRLFVCIFIAFIVHFIIVKLIRFK